MQTLLTSAFILLHATLAVCLCPIHGPTFPYPKNLDASAILKSALLNLTEALEAGFASGNSSSGPVDPDGATAIQIFSLEDKSAALYEYYSDGTTLVNSTGVKKVDGDSIFRIGSVSKLHTVYLVLAQLGDRVWHMPVAEAIPELRDRTKSKGNPVDYVDWEDITLGALAGQVSGVTRDCKFEALCVK
jgi:CubicO group peptidase (beta-lactamase class C family)